MNTRKPSNSKSAMQRWFALVHLPMILLAIYVHYLLHRHGYIHGNNFLENAGLWLLFTFKIVGANMILGGIFSEFKITRS